jgi:hypothetical protein
VSTRDQHLDRLLAALVEARCSRLFAEKLSGRNVERPEPWAGIDCLRSGDVLSVVELSRFGRSLDDPLPGRRREHPAGRVRDDRPPPVTREQQMEVLGRVQLELREYHLRDLMSWHDYTSSAQAPLVYLDE